MAAQSLSRQKITYTQKLAQSFISDLQINGAKQVWAVTRLDKDDN